MKKLITTLFCLLGFICISSAQYSEPFNTNERGILNGPCTGTSGTTCASTNFTGVTWTVEGPMLNVGSEPTAFGPTNNFKTSGQVLTTVGGDIDVEVCWVSPLLDISSAGNDVDFSVDISYTGFDTPDYIDVKYSIDGGSFLIAQANLVGSNGHTINGSDFVSGGVTGSNNNVGISGGLSGNTLQIMVCVDFNSAQENFTLDNVEVLDAGVIIAGSCTDAAPPTISCPGPQPGVLDGDCNFQAIDYTGLATTSDDCGPVTVTQNPIVGQPFNGVGNTVVTLTATDGASNTATCNMTLNLVDQSAPTISCPPTANRNVNASCQYMLEDFTGSATTNDNCDASPSVTQNPPTGTNLGVGSHSVTLTTTDASGNTATCSFNVSVTDNMPPNAVCQNGTVQLNGSGNGSINSSALDAGTTDNCPGAISYVPTSFSFTCSNVGPNTVTLSVVDVSFNTATCTAVVTVQDNIGPTAVCQNASVTLSGTSASISASQVDGGSTDNCPPVARSVTPNTFDCSNVGANTVTLLVIETSGGIGFSTCTATVTVVDDTPPTAVCQTTSVNIGQTLMASEVDNGSSDNCTNPPNLSVAPNTFGCANIGANNVTLTVDDNNGNTATCSTIVTVESNTPPTAVCANFTTNIIVSYEPMAFINANDVDGGSSSLCSTVSLDVSPTFFTCSDIGSNTVTLTATDDGNGLTATCTAVVTVADPSNLCCAGPVAVCNNTTVQLDNLGNGSVSASVIGAGSTADCGLASEIVNPSTFDCDDVGPNTVTYTIIDINGTDATCTAVVTVEDNIAPVPTCVNTTVELGADGTGTLAPSAIHGGSMEACGFLPLSANPTSFTCNDIGSVTVTLTVSDINGNSATCTASVTIDEGDALPDEPLAATANKAFCQNADLVASLANTGVNVSNSLTADEKVVWVLTSAPVGSAYIAGDEFTTPTCGDPFENFGELAVANTSKVIRVQTPGTAPVGTYTFDAYIENCVSGCTSDMVSGFSITVYAAPSVMITADPDGDLCLGQMDVEYSASITSIDGGTYSYMWCAYNSGNGSGTCFNGFDDNTAAMPTRDWTSSAGAKSVGVTVTSDVAGCEAEDLYSFEVVAPTMLECPMDMMGTLITDDMTFECAATFNWNHPAVLPGPCDPVILTITISGGSVSEGPTVVTPGDPYSYTFEELGVFTVTYDLVDAVGNTSTCSFTITVEGLPCGWVDNGGIGCADDQNSSSFDQNTETFSVTANNCALTGWPYISDQMAFVFTEMCGDGEIIARVTGVSSTGFGGVMMRDSEDPSAPFMAIGTNRVNKVLRQVRTLPSYPAFPQFVLSYDQFWVRIVRSGNQFMGFASTDGVGWIPYLNQQVFMSNNCLRVGLFTYSEKPGNPITATFSNVTLNGMPLFASGGSSTSQNLGDLGQATERAENLWGLSPDISLYPNPAQDLITLNVEQIIGEAANISIFNVNGRLVKQLQYDAIEDVTTVIKVEALPAGTYFVHVKTTNTHESLRFVKQ